MNVDDLNNKLEEKRLSLPLSCEILTGLQDDLATQCIYMQYSKLIRRCTLFLTDNYLYHAAMKSIQKIILLTGMLVFTERYCSRSAVFLI
mmetsp:Transcript_15858/g.20871  ORF Transcript_15858/g.20871 Transcript_15858/m.20871 type:complete len:90 (+) Transcript_15858:682-951(+)